MKEKTKIIDFKKYQEKLLKDKNDESSRKLNKAMREYFGDPSKRLTANKPKGK